VLHNLPLFQFTGLLALATIIKKWKKGRKNNENKIPLIRWDTITKPLWQWQQRFFGKSLHPIRDGLKMFSGRNASWVPAPGVWEMPSICPIQLS